MVHVQEKKIEIGNTAKCVFQSTYFSCCLHFTRELLCWAWHYKSSFGQFIIKLKMGVGDLYAELAWGVCSMV